MQASKQAVNGGFGSASGGSKCHTAAVTRRRGTALQGTEGRGLVLRPAMELRGLVEKRVCVRVGRMMMKVRAIAFSGARGRGRVMNE
jgi:hypothetical protein